MYFVAGKRWGGGHQLLYIFYLLHFFLASKRNLCKRYCALMISLTGGSPSTEPHAPTDKLTSQILMGFWGGVPLNTETAAVNPRVGVAGPPRGVSRIPMPPNPAGLAEISRRLALPSIALAKEGQRSPRYVIPIINTPRQGRRNFRSAAFLVRNPEDSYFGGVWWFSVVSSGLPALGFLFRLVYGPGRHGFLHRFCLISAPCFERPFELIFSFTEPKPVRFRSV
jgi:hypothetical protein